jgi:hypothetical protein
MAHQPSNGLGVPDPDASQGPVGPIGGEINLTMETDEGNVTTTPSS